MELKIKLGYEQILELIKQLPQKEIEKLTHALQKKLSSKSKSKNIALQELILQAPTWSEKEYADFLEARKYVNQFFGK